MNNTLPDGTPIDQKYLLDKLKDISRELGVVLNMLVQALPHIRYEADAFIEEHNQLADKRDQELRERAATNPGRPSNDPFTCDHKRQKWALDMRSGHCEDCGAQFTGNEP